SRRDWPFGDNPRSCDDALKQHELKYSDFFYTIMEKHRKGGSGFVHIHTAERDKQTARRLF
ncbi:hypothetical protein ACLI1Z_16565, partial [Enterococcus faecalis]|uniref:hypothetical protein n=1 Tax=Enterococcus faecalis TaxID=1351 RepID=UPI00398528AC